MSRLMKKLLWTAILPLVVMALLTFGLTSLLIGRFAETESYDQLAREADIVYEALVDGRGIPGQLDVLVFQDGEAVNLERGGRMRRQMTPMIDPDALSERDEVSVNGMRLLTFLREEGDVQIVTYAPVPLSNPQFRQIYVILGSGFLLALLVAVGVTYWMGRRLTSPLIELKQATASIMSGRHDFTLPPVTDDEIGDLTEAVRQMNTSLEEKERLQNTFISGITHDVRTPLAIVRNEAEMLELGVVKQEDVAATGRSMTEEVDRIDRLVTQMLEYSKLSAGKLALTIESVHMNELIEATVARMEEWFRHKQVTVTLELVEDAVVQADRLAMERILSNFLQNAYHASPIGGVITIRLTERRLEIEDDGPGITESMRANIWDMYVKGDRSNGHGLGLAINKLLLEAQGLSYGIESREGALFWIEWD
ncbi:MULTISPECIES: HAMP domain-containing sensor histidine kinase [Exiguobacterium]|uniref:HAMP domain-containing sensor histidine kinase n=1 Tax=Exiguobacterium TaxID=33986 RepID=UPI001BE9B0A2|nr:MULTISPECIES: HAMP domain-containing sensor histidine kinase [Exiguobacterium]MCT4778236.1 HAMP domain-containing histidine kinase [Exiguobacterium aquaticum]MCT4789298.1 HAMP domain-containing histidine kinase [Exiguobacterium mexicanum]